MGTESDLYREPETDAERDVARRWGIRFYRDEPAPVAESTDGRRGSGTPMTDAGLMAAIPGPNEPYRDDGRVNMLMTNAEVAAACRGDGVLTRLYWDGNSSAGGGWSMGCHKLRYSGVRDARTHLVKDVRIPFRDISDDDAFRLAASYLNLDPVGCPECGVMEVHRDCYDGVYATCPCGRRWTLEDLPKLLRGDRDRFRIYERFR
jgi:hypothetical protein